MVSPCPIKDEEDVPTKEEQEFAAIAGADDGGEL